MDHHPPRAGAPRAGTRRRSIRWLTTAALVLVLGGCGSPDHAPLDDSGAAASGEGSSAAGDGSTGSSGSSGSTGSSGSSVPTASSGSSVPTTLGDPADVGFEPVVDDEVEPIEAADPAAVDLTEDSPAEVVAEVDDQIASSGTTGPLLDAVDPIDAAAPVEADGRPRNELGELVELDEAASLACAKVEIAIGALDDGEVAAASDGVVAGSGYAGRSAVADIRAWAAPLEEAATGSLGQPATLIGFLSICAEGGYEL